MPPLAKFSGPKAESVTADDDTLSKVKISRSQEEFAFRKYLAGTNPDFVLSVMDEKTKYSILLKARKIKQLERDFYKAETVEEAHQIRKDLRKAVLCYLKAQAVKFETPFFTDEIVIVPGTQTHLNWFAKIFSEAGGNRVYVFGLDRIHNGFTEKLGFRAGGHYISKKNSINLSVNDILQPHQFTYVRAHEFTHFNTDRNLLRKQQAPFYGDIACSDVIFNEPLDGVDELMCNAIRNFRFDESDAYLRHLHFLFSCLEVSAKSSFRRQLRETCSTLSAGIFYSCANIDIASGLLGQNSHNPTQTITFECNVDDIVFASIRYKNKKGADVQVAIPLTKSAGINILDAKVIFLHEQIELLKQGSLNNLASFCRFAIIINAIIYEFNNNHNPKNAALILSLIKSAGNQLILNSAQNIFGDRSSSFVEQVIIESFGQNAYSCEVLGQDGQLYTDYKNLTSGRGVRVNSLGQFVEFISDNMPMSNK